MRAAVYYLREDLQDQGVKKHKDKDDHRVINRRPKITASAFYNASGDRLIDLRLDRHVIRTVKRVYTDESQRDVYSPKL
jgi:hypothetical protein